MWIVQLALRRPYTFVVAALVLLLLTPLTLQRTPTDAAGVLLTVLKSGAASTNGALLQTAFLRHRFFWFFPQAVQWGA
jgi:hypothetical protein